MAVLTLLAATLLFHIADPGVDEASGIVTSVVDSGVVSVQNDSGDSARFFALDIHTGRTVATYTVPNATNIDWEDIAVARDRRGVPSLWLADIGDNDARRTEVRIYRVDEPRGPAAGQPELWRLRYPDGSHDAESLAVAPGGAVFIVTKSLLGSSTVYAVPARPGGVQTLRTIGEIRFAFTGTRGGPNVVGQLTATGAAFSRDGTLLAVRTYTDAYLWRVVDGNVAAALHTAPVRVALPPQPQGEASRWTARGCSSTRRVVARRCTRCRCRTQRSRRLRRRRRARRPQRPPSSRTATRSRSASPLSPSLSSGSSSCGWSTGGADELSDGYGTLGGVTESVHRERR